MNEKNNSTDWQLVEDINEHLKAHFTRRPEDREGIDLDEYKEIRQRARREIMRFVKLNQREKSIQYGRSDAAKEDEAVLTFLEAVESGSYEIPETGESFISKASTVSEYQAEIPADILSTPAIVGRVLWAIANRDTNALERIKKAIERIDERARQRKAYPVAYPAKAAVHEDIKRNGLPASFDHFLRLIEIYEVEGMKDEKEARKWYKELGGKMKPGPQPARKMLKGKKELTHKKLGKEVDQAFKEWEERTKKKRPKAVNNSGKKKK